MAQVIWKGEEGGNQHSHTWNGHVFVVDRPTEVTDPYMLSKMGDERYWKIEWSQDELDAKAEAEQEEARRKSKRRRAADVTADVDEDEEAEETSKRRARDAISHARSIKESQDNRAADKKAQEEREAAQAAKKAGKRPTQALADKYE